MSDKILKLNQAQTLYNDLRERIEALPTDNDIPTKISDLTDDSGHYTKPTTGIPASDLSEEIVSIIDGKAPAIYCEKSGAIVSFDDGAGNMPLKECVVNIESVQDLHGYDYPWPAGGGKNLFNPQVILAAGGSYSNDVYSATQAQLQSVDFTAIHFDENTQYYFYAYGKSNGENTGHAMRIKVTYTDESTSYISLLFNGSSYQEKSGTSTANKSIASIAFSAYGVTVGSEFTKFMICKASDGTSYAPYENICPITGWTGAKVTRTGKNLFDKSAITVGKWLNVDTGLEELTTTSYVLSDYIPVKTGITYVFQNPQSTRRWLYDKDKNPLARISNTSFTPSADGFCRITISTLSVDLDTYQIEFGSTATDYEPYQGETYDITFPTEVETVYGGSLDVTTGVLTVTWHGQVLKGTEPWSNYNGAYRFAVQTSNGFPPKVLGQTNIKCDKFNVRGYNSNNYVAIPSEQSAEFVDVDALKTYLATLYSNGNPAIIVYELVPDARTTYQLTPVEIRTLMTNPQNIWADTGDTSIEYCVDTKSYVDESLPDVPVQDVQIDGTSILDVRGVANVPIASGNDAGVVKVNGRGLAMSNAGVIQLAPAPSSKIKTADDNYSFSSVKKQNESTFYGLAKAAGADMKDIANTTIGTYPDAQKEAIQSMLGITQMLAPTNPNLVASQAYSIGDVFAANGHLYKATAAIAQDGAIIPDTNCVETTMADAGGKIKDVQVAGTSVVENGIANIPVASEQTPGVIKTSEWFFMNNGVASMRAPSEAQQKAGNVNRVVPVSTQHKSVFWGLAKAAGDTTQSQSSNTVGTYTDEAKSAIRTMIGASSTNVIAVQDTQPTDTDTKIWLPETAETPVEVPTVAEMNAALSEKVDDVQVNGVSVVSEGVANIRVATNSRLGAVSIGSTGGLLVNANGVIMTNPAPSANIKIAGSSYHPLVPAHQHESVFYGLAKAAGDTTQAASDNAVGTYTEEAKAAIRTMVGAVGTEDYATSTNAGVVMVNSTYGLKMMNGNIMISSATAQDVKSGVNDAKALSPAKQHSSTFYGLAKAAGDTTMASSSNAVGTYTDSAKASIKSMLGIQDGSTGTVDVSGATTTITAVENTRYVCGEVTSLSFTPPASGISIVRFTSGSTVTVLTLPSTVKFPEWFDPTSLETNTIYEICITDGVYGAVMSWAQ